MHMCEMIQIFKGQKEGERESTPTHTHTHTHAHTGKLTTAKNKKKRQEHYQAASTHSYVESNKSSLKVFQTRKKNF